MKRLIIVGLVLAFAKAVTAQTHVEFEHLSLPEITQKDAPSTNKVYRIQTVTYKADSLGHEATWLNVLNYNKNGLKFQHYDKSMGLRKNETLKEYFYTGKRLDSMVKTTSSRAFNLTVHYQYDSKHRIVKELGKGRFPYTQNYGYDGNSSSLKTVELVPNSGEIIKAVYNYDSRNQLDHVHQRTFKKDSDQVKKDFTIYYANGVPFARITKDRPLITVQDFTGVYKIRSSKNKEATIADLKIAALESKDAIFKKRKELAKNTNVLEQYSTSTDDRTNDWIKRHKVKRAFGKNQDWFLFRKLYYPDSTTSGDTNFDTLFEMRVKRR